MEEFMKNQVRTPKLPRVVILTPVYNEEDSLLHFEQSVNNLLLSRPDYDFHVLFIDDGSKDRTWAIIREICEKNSRFQGIRLSRNYGSHIALSAGFASAHGDAIAILACDLQDPPEVILDFLERWHSGAQIVWGRRRTRKDDYWRILPSKIFFKLMRRFAMPHASKFTTGSFLLVDRQVAKCLRQFHEQNRITFALVAWTGFDQAIVEYDRQERVAGKSGWNFSKMIKTMYDAFIGFSFLPIRIMKLLGVGAFLLTIPLSAYLIFSWLTGDPLMGWTSLMLTIAFFFGIQFLLMGIVGEYLYRIYAEAVRRPLYFISEKTYQSDAGGTNDD